MDGWGEWIGDKMIKGEGEKKMLGFCCCSIDVDYWGGGVRGGCGVI
jgi:hypothetical protein